MAYGDIHNSTGTVCKAQINCPMQGGHSKDVDEYVESNAEKYGLDSQQIQGMIKDGTPLADAVSIARDGLETQKSQQKSSKAETKTDGLPTVSGAGEYEISNEPLDLWKTSTGDRYYDNEGTGYIVNSLVRGSFAGMTKLNPDGSVPRTLNSEGKIRVGEDGIDASNFRKLNPPRDTRYTDGAPGVSESKAIKSLPEKGSWPKSVSAVVNYRDENGDTQTMELVAPAARLTDKKRVELGRQLFAFTGKDPKRYDDASDREKLSWANQRIMRRDEFQWHTTDDGNVLYAHKMGSGMRLGGSMKLVEL